MFQILLERKAQYEEVEGDASAVESPPLPGSSRKIQQIDEVMRDEHQKRPPSKHSSAMCQDDPETTAVPESLLSTIDHRCLAWGTASVASRQVLRQRQSTRHSRGCQVLCAYGRKPVSTPKHLPALASTAGPPQLPGAFCALRFPRAAPSGHRKTRPQAGFFSTANVLAGQVAGWLRRHTSTTTASSARERPARASPYRDGSAANELNVMALGPVPVSMGSHTQGYGR